MVIPRVEVVSMAPTQSWQKMYLCQTERPREVEPAPRTASTILLIIFKCSLPEKDFRYTIGQIQT